MRAWGAFPLAIFTSVPGSAAAASRAARSAWTSGASSADVREGDPTTPFHGAVGIFNWPKCEAWLDPDSTAAPPTEIGRLSTQPHEGPPDGGDFGPPGTLNVATFLR